MNREEIEKVDKALKYANEYKEYLEDKHKAIHKDCGYEYESIIPSDYETRNAIIEDINARFDKLHTLLESKGE